MNEQQDKRPDAKVIMHPALVNYQVYCNHCKIKGDVLTYQIYINDLMKVRFWCETCKKINPNHINMDLAEAPHLQLKPVIPMGYIRWDKATKTS